MKRKIKKLKYEIVEIEGYRVNFARSSSTHSMNIIIKPNNEIYYTIPIYVLYFSAVNFFKSKRQWIEKVIKKNSIKYSGECIKINKNYKLKLKEERELLSRINNYIKIYENMMGIKINKIKLRKMTSYGICHLIERNIVFSKALYYLPDEFVESVVVHEMAHLFVPNHSKKFYDKIEEYLPNYRKIWRKYKKIIVFEED